MVLKTYILLFFKSVGLLESMHIRDFAVLPKMKGTKVRRIFCEAISLFYFACP